MQAPSPGSATATSAEVEGLLRRRVREIAAELDERGAGLALDHAGDASGVLDVRARMIGMGVPGRVSAGGRARLVRGSDGWIAVSLPRPEDLVTVPAWLECDPGIVPAGGLDDVAWQALDDACAAHPVDRLVQRAALCGLPVFVVGEFAGAPGVIAEAVGEADPLPFGGTRPVRVVNLAGLWAGPLAADVCARLGGRVVTVESSARPDGARATPHFHAWLHGRDSIVSPDLRGPAGRAFLAEVIADADVVIEGSRPRALRQMGIDARSVLVDGPRVWLSITAAGRSEPHDVRVGFGDDAAAGGGVVGWCDHGPAFVADAAADPLTGLTAAMEIARRLDSGGRWLLDVALARVAGSLWR